MHINVGIILIKLDTYLLDLSIHISIHSQKANILIKNFYFIFTKAFMTAIKALYTNSNNMYHKCDNASYTRLQVYVFSIHTKFMCTYMYVYVFLLSVYNVCIYSCKSWYIIHIQNK